jgi:regulatory protein
MPLPQPSLKGRALKLLSGREHSRLELERKLQQFEETPGQLAQALDELTAKGFVSDARVIESLVHRRAPKLGLGRLKQELQGKGLPAEAVASALAGLQATERERAQAIWRKKFGAPPADAQAAAKQMRFLASRGFSGDIVRRLVSGGFEDISTEE